MSAEPHGLTFIVINEHKHGSLELKAKPCSSVLETKLKGRMSFIQFQHKAHIVLVWLHLSKSETCEISQ